MAEPVSCNPLRVNEKEIVLVYETDDPGVKNAKCFQEGGVLKFSATGGSGQQYCHESGPHTSLTIGKPMVDSGNVKVTIKSKEPIAIHNFK